MRLDHNFVYAAPAKGGRKNKALMHAETLREKCVSVKTTVCRIFSCQRSAQPLGLRRDELAIELVRKLSSAAGVTTWLAELCLELVIESKAGGEYRARTGDRKSVV